MLPFFPIDDLYVLCCTSPECFCHGRHHGLFFYLYHISLSPPLGMKGEAEVHLTVPTHCHIPLPYAFPLPSARALQFISSRNT